MLTGDLLNENTLGGIHVVWGRDKSDPPASFMGSIPHDLNQSINQIIKVQFIVWHIRPYHDTISHIIEHWYS